jgi:hypothetical protein
MKLTELTIPKSVVEIDSLAFTAGDFGFYKNCLISLTMELSDPTKFSMHSNTFGTFSALTTLKLPNMVLKDA